MIASIGIALVIVYQVVSVIQSVTIRILGVLGSLIGLWKISLLIGLF